jgi:hypothetical protein
MGRKLAIVSAFIVVIGGGLLYLALQVSLECHGDISCKYGFIILLISGIVVVIPGLILFFRNWRDLPQT